MTSPAALVPCIAHARAGKVRILAFLCCGQLFMAVGLPQNAAAQLTPCQKLLAADGNAGDLLGFSVSLGVDRALAGAYYDDHRGPAAGSAYVFSRSGTTWGQQQKLTASDGVKDDYFGRAVAIGPDLAVAGAYGDDDRGASSGSVYVFAQSGSTWAQQQKLTANDGDKGDLLGYSVSLKNRRILAGAHFDEDRGSSSGAAYVFVQNGAAWVQQQKLTAADGAPSDSFGFTVSLNGDTALISSYRDDDRGSSSGSAYVFVQSGAAWIQQQKLTAADGALDDYFGAFVSLDGDTALIGAYGDDDRGAMSGAAYLFTRAGTVWTQQQKLTASDGAASDFFGSSVTIQGDWAVVAANMDDDRGSTSGSAYLFTRIGPIWKEQQKLTAADGASLDYFGQDLSLQGNTLLVGVYRDDDKGKDSGSAILVEQRSGPTSGQYILGVQGLHPDGERARGEPQLTARPQRELCQETVLVVSWTIDRFLYGRQNRLEAKLITLQQQAIIQRRRQRRKLLLDPSGKHLDLAGL